MTTTNVSTIDAPRIAYRDHVCMVATWRSIVIPVMGSGIVPGPSARQQARALEAHAKAVGKGKLGEVTIIARDAPVPGPEARAIYDAAVPTISPYYACVSALFEGTGFRAALVRGVITSFQVLSRTKWPQKVFSNPDECGAWLYSYRFAMGMDAADPNEIASAIKAVRAIAIETGVFSPVAAKAVAANDPIQPEA